MTHVCEYDETTSSYRINENHPVLIKVCGHVFGRDCLSKHTHGDMPSSSLCPMCRAPLFGFAQDQNEVTVDYGQIECLIQDYDELVAAMDEERRELKRLRHQKDCIIKKELPKDPRATLTILLINKAMTKEMRKVRSRRHQLQLLRIDIHAWVAKYDMVIGFADVKAAVRIGMSLEYAWEEFIGFG
jgi:hypothetical protein